MKVTGPIYLLWLLSASNGICTSCKFRVPKYFVCSRKFTADSDGMRFWEKSCPMQSSSIHPTTKKKLQLWVRAPCASYWPLYKIGIAAVRLRKSMCTDTNLNSCWLQKSGSNKKRQKNQIKCRWVAKLRQVIECRTIICVRPYKKIPCYRLQKGRYRQT